MKDNILTKNEIKEIFNSDEYKDFNVLLVTSDKKVFKKHINAVSYCDENKLNIIQNIFQIYRPIEMSKLTKYGFKARYDTFESYMLNIDDFNIIIDKHINETKYKCWIVSNYDGVKSDEICINDDCIFEWVMDLVELLKNK